MTFDPNAQRPTIQPGGPSATPSPRLPQPADDRRAPRRIALTTTVALCMVSALAGGALALNSGSVAHGASADLPAAAVDVTGSATVSTNILADTNVVSDVAREAGPAVVAILSGGTASAGSSGLSPQGAGSGVIVDAGGLILTNRHVVGDNRSVTVFLADGREFTGTVEGVDTLTDLALLSIDATGLTTATLGDSSSVEVGDLAVAIGNPQGDLPGSVTAGIISALERQIVVGDMTGTQAPEALGHLIQHDAAINPGNSGGPLLTADGSVIAINTAMAGGAQGIGFAIPINLAKPIVRQILAGDPIRRPYVGIYFTEIDAQLAQDEGLAVDQGVLIRGDASSGQPGVIVNGPAEAAGLKDGDILTRIDGQIIDATHQLDVALLEHEPGESVSLTVLRGDRTLKRDVLLGIRPSDFVG